MTLFVSDLDGTLVDDAGDLSAFSRDTLNAAMEAGTRFTIATARSVHTMAPMIDGLQVRLPVVEFNGAYVSDLATHRPQFCRALAAEVARSVSAIGLEHELGAFLSTWDGERQGLHPPEAVTNDGMRWYLGRRRSRQDPRLREADTAVALALQVVTLTFMARQEALVPLEARIRDAHGEHVKTNLFENLYSPGWHWLTVGCAQATKAHALRELTAQLGVDLADVTVFGDGLNDLPMFGIAGHSVAVGNALPEVRAAADEVIEANTTDAVARYVAARSPGGTP